MGTTVTYQIDVRADPVTGELTVTSYVQAITTTDNPVNTQTATASASQLVEAPYTQAQINVAVSAATLDAVSKATNNSITAANIATVAIEASFAKNAEYTNASQVAAYQANVSAAEAGVFVVQGERSAALAEGSAREAGADAFRAGVFARDALKYSGLAGLSARDALASAGLAGLSARDALASAGLAEGYKVQAQASAVAAASAQLMQVPQGQVL